MVIEVIVSRTVIPRDTKYWQGFFKFVKERGVLQANDQQTMEKFE